MLEDYYGVDEVIDLEVWKGKFNIPPREMAPKSGSQTALSLSFQDSRSPYGALG